MSKKVSKRNKAIVKRVTSGNLRLAAIAAVFPMALTPICSMAESKAAIVQQNSEGVIIGTVVDSKGEPLIGVTISTGEGKHVVNAVTDLDGHFSIKVEPGVTLHISYIGYEAMNVKAMPGMTVTLKELDTQLQGVEVVAYGVQKKVTVTGAISTIGSDQLNQTPVSSVSQILAGQATGVSSIQSSGEPGNDAAQIFVRGKSTWSGYSPLIQVDGVERDMNDIDPEEIESITILKDASATAVFGVRGANGVILITTKRGKEGKAKISASVSTSLLVPNRTVEQANSYEYATFYNMTMRNDLYGTDSYNDETKWKVFSDEIIEKFRTQSEPIRFPSMRWTDYIFKDHSLQSKANLNISGGTSTVRYFISAGMYTQEGLIKEWDEDYDAGYNYSRFNYRTNLDIDVTPTTTLSVNLAGSVDNVARPLIGSTSALMKQIYYASPFVSPGIVDHKFITTSTDYTDLALPFTGSNPMGWYGTGYYKYGTNRFTSDLVLRQKLDFITKGLSFHIKGAYNTAFTVAKTGDASMPTYTPVLTGYDDDGNPIYNYKQNGSYSRAKVSTSSGKSRDWYFEVGFNWNRRFGLHNLTALLLYNQSKKYYPSTYSNIPKGYVGLVGRVTWDWNNRYMAEFNVGYNGSENFRKGKRYGIFPAFSAGWVISEEKFMKPLEKIISFMKIRASWGLVGNDQTGSERFYYTPDVYTVNQVGYFFGVDLSTRSQSAYESTKHNSEVTWEKSFKQDYGVDMNFFDNRLSTSFDYYHEHRKDILVSDASAPAFLGFTVPKANLGITHSWGWEVSAKWRDFIGKDWEYWAGVNLSYNQNEILEMKEAVKNNAYEMQKGHRIGARSLLKFFEYYSENTAAHYKEVYGVDLPTQLVSDLRPGDCVYVDLDGNGKIDSDDYSYESGKYTDDPEYTIGLNLGFRWKDLSVNTQWTGAWNVSRCISGIFRYPFYTSSTFTQGGLLKYIVDNSWTEDNPDPNARYPRSSFDHGKVNNYAASDLYEEDAKYLRLKTLQINYNFHFSFMKKLGLETLQASLSGYNLLTFTPFIFGDPETSVSDAPSYPLQRTYTLSIKVGF
jgi:TonB-linked SusC/RagA family outer membrane protein